MSGKLAVMFTILTIVLVTAIIIATEYVDNDIAEYNRAEMIEAIGTDREKALDQKIEETKDQWEQKHRNWAEQEVSRDIIMFEEQQLAELRKIELSF